MNKALVVIFCSLTVLFQNCKNDPKTADPNAPASAAATEHLNPAILAGHWIAADFSARANQYNSVLGAMNNATLPLAYAFSFSADRQDSVTCYNGEKSWKLPIRINIDTIEVIGAKNGKSIFFGYEPATQDLSLFDATNGTATMERYIKSKADVTSGYLAFTTSLNNHLFEGTYTPVGKTPEKPIFMQTNGSISNFPEYDRYAVCTNGDCFKLGDKMDIINMVNSNTPGSSKLFGFRFSAQADTLTLYNLNLGEGNAAATIGSVAHRWLHKTTKNPVAPAKKEGQ